MKLLITILALTLSFCTQKAPEPKAQAQDTGRLRERLNKIFYWQLADELKLSPQEEAKMTGVLESFRSKKEELLAKQAELQLRIEAHNANEQNQEESSQILADYKATVSELARLDVTELEELGAIFGEDQMIEFLKARKKMSDRLRKALTQK